MNTKELSNAETANTLERTTTHQFGSAHRRGRLRAAPRGGLWEQQQGHELDDNAA